MLLDGSGKFAEFGSGKGTARVTRIWFQKFDRHLALIARPFDMGGLAADIADQTCKTAAQSRTRFVGHRQLPWIHAATPELESLISDRRVGKAKRAHRNSPTEDGGHGADAFAHPTGPRLMRPQLALALDHFGGKLQ